MLSITEEKVEESCSFVYLVAAKEIHLCDRFYVSVIKK